MSYAAGAKWVRQRLWIAVAAGAVPWLMWLGGLASNAAKAEQHGEFIAVATETSEGTAPPGARQDLSGNLVGADHLAFYHAARLIRDGHADRLYDYKWLQETDYQKALVGWDWKGFEAYRNPPFYALLYLPTAGLSFYASFAVWTVIGFALLALAIHLLQPARPWRVFLWALTFYPVFATVGFGQNTFISLTIFAGVYRLLRAERPFAAGLVAGLLFFKPQLLLGVFVWWAFQPVRYWKCGAGVCVTGALLAAVSWLAVPSGSRAFVDSLTANAAFGGFGMWNVVNPKAFFALLMPKLPEVYWPLAALCSLAGIAVAWRLKRRTGAPLAVMFPAAVFLSLWASPHALVYEWALLIAAAVVLWERFPGSRDVWLCVFALAWVALAVGVPLASMQIRSNAAVVLQVAVPLLGLAGWLAAKELARSPEAQARPAGAQIPGGPGA